MPPRGYPTTPGEAHLAFWQSELLNAGCCYVLRAGDLPPIKVGYATDVWARIDSLQTGNAYPLRLIEVIPGPPSIERVMHLKLRKLKVSRVLNEWFDGPNVEAFLTYVGELAKKMADAHDGGYRKPPDVAVVDPSLEVPARYRQHEVSVPEVVPESNPPDYMEPHGRKTFY